MNIADIVFYEVIPHVPVFWILVSIFFVNMLVLLSGILVITLWTTPALKYLRAIVKRRPLVRQITNTGIEEYKEVSSYSQDGVDVKNHGPMITSPGSHTTQRSGKVPILTAFSNYGVTIDPMYPAILDEIRTAGYDITTYEDYHHLIKLSTDEEYAKNWIAEVTEAGKKEEGGDKSKERHAEALAFVNRLREFEVFIRPFKAYKMGDLADMFPNDINVVYTEQKILNEVQRRYKKILHDKSVWLIALFVVCFMLIAFAIAWKVMGTASCPAPVVNFPKDAVRTVVEVATANATGGNVVV